MKVSRRGLWAVLYLAWIAVINFAFYLQFRAQIADRFPSLARWLSLNF